MPCPQFEMSMGTACRAPTNMHYLFYKVHKNDIYLIKFILESYENIAQVSTVDRGASKLQITVAPDFLVDVQAIIADLQKTYFMQEIFDDPTVSQGRY